ncbi:MAG: FAD-binding protein [Pseudomonadota bacterium]
MIGAGPAGLAAAWELEQAGRSVLLVDGHEAVGGRARWGLGLSLLAGTATQHAAGVEDSPEELLADWEAMTGEPPSAAERAFTMGAPAQVHDWLAGLGLRWGTLQAEATSERLRVHFPEGGSPAMVATIAAALQTPPRLGTFVTGLERAEGGGWRVRLGEETVLSPRVVLATGSLYAFRARAEAAAAASPCSLDALVDGKDGALPIAADTLGLLAGVAPGTADIGALGTYPHVLATPEHPFVDVLHAVVVGADGRVLLRGEEWSSLAAGARVAAEPDCVAWALFDQRDAAGFLRGVAPDLQARLLGEGRVLLRRDSPAELAAAMGVEPAVLEATLAQGPPGPRAPPLWAARLGLVAGKSFGGLATDTEGRLLDTEGQPIPGLWAAGEAAGMGGVGAPAGFDGSLSAVVFSGRVAGRHAAAD